MSGLIDRFGRTIDYLRVSVIDRCNLRCIYCKTEEYTQVPRKEILSLEEIFRIVRCASECGISKVRITGGEPLIRKNLVYLISMVNTLDTIEDISLTTNGTLLEKYGEVLFSSGVRRVNISLDTLKRERFKRITGTDRLDDVLKGIETALTVGFSPVKINVVVVKDLNEDEIRDFAKLTLERPITVRFIEHMPVHTSHVYFSLKNIHKILTELGEIKTQNTIVGNGPAVYVKYRGSPGSIGIITPMSNGFCEGCNRLRLTAEGRLYTCLMSDKFFDVKKVIRLGGSDQEIKSVFKKAVREKPASPDESNGEKVIRKPMASIGG
jgi:cyclic pyranopterin phosphate synthase